MKEAKVLIYRTLLLVKILNLNDFHFLPTSFINKKYKTVANEFRKA